MKKGPREAAGRNSTFTAPGIYIFLDTRHSNTQAVPLPSIHRVGDFRY